MNEVQLQSGTPEIELEQRAFRTKITYRFFSNYVEYTIRDSTGALSSFGVNYSGLPAKVDYGTYQPARRSLMWNQIILLMFLTLLIITAIREKTYGTLVIILVFVAVGTAGSALVRSRMRKTYTSIPAGNRKILVLRDGRHDGVLKELESRRLGALRKLAIIDTFNSPRAELRKFVWLAEQGVISEQECEFFRQKLIESTKGISPVVPPTKPPGEIIQ